MCDWFILSDLVSHINLTTPFFPQIVEGQDFYMTRSISVSQVLQSLSHKNEAKWGPQHRIEDFEFVETFEGEQNNMKWGTVLFYSTTCKDLKGQSLTRAVSTTTSFPHIFSAALFLCSSQLTTFFFSPFEGNCFHLNTFVNIIYSKTVYIFDGWKPKKNSGTEPNIC